MKPKASLRAFLLGSTLLAAPFSLATTLTWDANGITANQTDGAGAWLNANQWWNGSSNVNWTSGDNAVFGNGGAGGAVTLASPTTVGSLTFNYFTGTYTLGTAGQTITLNNGITKNASPGVATIISPVTLGAAQTWTNNNIDLLATGATNTLNATGGVDNGGFTLTIDGSGTTNFGGTTNFITGTGGLTKNGTGVLVLSAGGSLPLHNYSGTTTINGGTIRIQNGNNSTGTGNLTINGGVLEFYFSNNVIYNYTRTLGSGAGQVQILGGVSGFSEQGAGGNVILNNSAAFEVVWGAANEASNVLSTGFFNPSTFVLQADTVNAGKTISFANKLDLNGTTRSIYVGQGPTTIATISNVIRTSSGTAGLTKVGLGNLTLTAANTYNGGTTINGGLLTFSGAAGAITSTSGITLNGGTLQMINTTAQTAVDRVNSAAISGTAGGGITWTNSSGNSVVYAETLGSVSVSSGQFNIVETNNQAGTGTSAQTLTLGGLSRSGSSAITFSAGVTGPQASGNRNMIVVTDAGTTTGGNIIGPWATTGLAANAQRDYAVYSSDYVTAANISASGEGSWATTGTPTADNYTMDSSGGVITLGATRNINSLRNTVASAQTIGSVNANVGVETVTITSHGYIDGTEVVFGQGAPGGLTAGTKYYVKGSTTDTFQLSALADLSTTVNLTNAGTSGNEVAPYSASQLTLASGADLGTFGILNGSTFAMTIAPGTGGSVTLPTTSAGQLHVNTGSSAITISAPITDNTGALTLVKNGSAGTLILSASNNTYTGDTIVNAGTLQVGVSGSATQLNGGAYNGNIFIAAGAAFTMQGNSSNTLGGIISGDGNLNLIRGSTTLSGNNTYTGKTTIGLIATNAVGNTVSVSSFNSVVGGTASSSLGAPTTVANGTIDFGGGVQATATLNYTGTGETTDRVINFIFNGNSNRVIDSSASGVLKFTSAATSNGTNSSVVLQGTGNGEFVHGLGFSFNNLTKSGDGTWTLGGAVGSTGVLTVNGGTLALQKKSSLMGGNTANWTAAKVIVNTGGTLAVNVGGAGELNNTDATTVLTNLGGLGGAINNNGLRSGSTIGFDTTNAAGGTFTIADEIKNATGTGSGAIGLTKLGTGTLALTGATHTYTGATTVSAGKLVINGNISTSSLTTVAVGATLGGSGTVGKAIINGTLAVGNSPGQMDFTDTLGLNGTTIMEIDGTAGAGVASGHDFVNLTGAGAAGVLSYGGILMLDMGVIFGSGSYTWNLFDFATETGTFTTVSLADQYSGSLLDDDLDGVWDLTSGDNTWQFTESTGVLGLTVVPEPRAALLGGLGVLMLLRRRR